MKKWFENCFRRNLVDIHIEDWSEEFLSRFSEDEYFDNLVTAKIQCAMIYLQSHIGYCYWPTESGHMHNALKGREDMIKRLIDRCRKNGIAVVGYYSLIYNNWAATSHPDWQMIRGEGFGGVETGTRYKFCCPNNLSYREFVLMQIEEISQFFSLDGMFYDMTFWPEVCHCEHCKKRWQEEGGGVIPMENWDDGKWNLFVKKRQEWIGEFAHLVTGRTKELMPHVTVEHNYAGVVAFDWMAGSTELINEACDYTGGDLYGDLYNHSFTCKYYLEITKNNPFEYMTCRVNNRLSQHTVTKSAHMLSHEVMLTAAHHGASLIIDAIDPAGTLDGRVYKRIGEVFSKQIPYEEWMSRGELIADAAAFFDTTAKHGREQVYSNRDCALNTVKTLIEEHIPVTVLSLGNLHNIGKYKLVFASDTAAMSEGTIDRLIEYVYNGGTLYFSGRANDRMLNTLLGAKFIKMSEETVTYATPLPQYEYIFGEFNQKYPLHCPYPQPLLEAGREGVLATLTLPYTLPSEPRFASIHSNPPGRATDYPSLMVRKYGKGKAIWSGAPIENESRSNYKEIIRNIIKHLACLSPTITADAPPRVEIVSFRGEGFALVSLVDLMGIEDSRAISGITVRIRTERPPKRVELLPQRKEIPFSYEGEYVSFCAQPLLCFDMYNIIETE